MCADDDADMRKYESYLRDVSYALYGDNDTRDYALLSDKCEDIVAEVIKLRVLRDSLLEQSKERIAEIAAHEGSLFGALEPGWAPLHHGWNWQPLDAAELGQGERAWCDRPDTTQWPKNPHWRWYYVPPRAKTHLDWMQGLAAGPRAAMRACMEARALLKGG